MRHLSFWPLQIHGPLRAGGFYLVLDFIPFGNLEVDRWKDSAGQES